MKNKINSQFVFSENKQGFIQSDRDTEEWYPINFQWIPIKKLQENMKR